MIVGIPNKLNLLALPRALKRAVQSENNKPREKREKTRRPGPITAFSMMMERHADLLIRQMGE